MFTLKSVHLPQISNATLTEKNTLHKAERLTHTKQIDRLFASGRWLRSEHLRVIYLVDDESAGFSCKALFSCPKRFHRRAVKRNLLKRRMREAYRLNKHNFYSQVKSIDKSLWIGFIITVPDIPEYRQIHREIRKLLAQVESRLNKKLA